MKPGGLCPPGDGRALPPGEGVGLPQKLSDACTQFPKGPATPREGRACLTPDLYEEGRQGSQPDHSPLNGHLGQEALLNGSFHRDCQQVLSPPQSEDGDEDKAHPSPVGPRPGTIKPHGPPAVPTGVAPALPSICGKRYEQLTVITAEPRGRGGAPPANPTTPSPGSSTLCSPSPGQQGAGLGRGAGITSPRAGCKGQRGRRKCSLEEVMSKLYSRHGTHTQVGQNALQNFPLTDRLLGVHQVPPGTGEGSSDRTVTLPPQQPSPTTPTTSVYESNSVTPLPCSAPVGQAVQGPGLRTSRQDVSPGTLSVRTPSVVSDSVAGLAVAAAAAAAAVNTMPHSVPGASPPLPRQNHPQDTEQPTDTDRHASSGPDRGMAHTPAVLNLPVSTTGHSSCSHSPADTPADGRATAVPGGAEVCEGEGEQERSVASPLEELGSGRSSSVEVLEGDGAGGSQASESDIEVLFDGTGGAATTTTTSTTSTITTTTTTTTTTTISVEKTVKSTAVAAATTAVAATTITAAATTTATVAAAPATTATLTLTGVAAAVGGGGGGGGGSSGKVGEGHGAAVLLPLPSMVGGAPYLEPISDDENSLLTSDLSSVSGALSNSNTPMFSDTPSDASRGALMVKISDAVAAILSDVSDDSLPDSPLASSSNSTDGFPSARQQAERLSRKISSICDKLEQDCGREGGPAPRPVLGVAGVSSDAKDSRTSPPCAPCPPQPPVAETVFPPIQERAGLSLIPCVALSSSSSSSLSSTPSPRPPPSSSPPPPPPPPLPQPQPQPSSSPSQPSSSSSPPPPPQSCESVSVCEIPVKHTEQQLQESPVHPPGRDCLLPDPPSTTTTSTSTLPSPPPTLPSVEGEELQAGVAQSGGDCGPADTKAEGESVVPSGPSGPSDSALQPPSSAPVVASDTSPDSPREGPGLPPHVPHTDLGTNYCSKSMDADDSPCQNHISGSQTVSSQNRFCNIHPGDVTQPPAGATPPGHQAGAPSESPIPPGHLSPTPDPAGPTVPQKPAAPLEEEEEEEENTALCDAGNSEAPTLPPDVVCADTTKQESDTCQHPQVSTMLHTTTTTTTTTTAQDTEQSSSEGTLLPSTECSTTTTPPPDTPLSSDVPQQDTPQTESLLQHTASVVRSPSGVEPVECVPQNSSEGPQQQCEASSSSGSEGCVPAPADPSTTTTTTTTTTDPMVVKEKEKEKEEEEEGEVVRSGGDTKVPGSVATSAAQHPTTSPDTPVPLTCPAKEETGPAGGLQDPDTPATSVPPAPTPPGCPNAPQALCSLGEATDSLLVSGSPGTTLGECVVGEDIPCCTTSPHPVTDPSSLPSSAPREGVAGEVGVFPHDSPSRPTCPEAEATDESPHTPSPPVATDTGTHTPQPELLACLGLEPRHPRPSEEVSVALTQPPNPSEVSGGGQESVIHQEDSLHPSDNIPTTTTTTTSATATAAAAATATNTLHPTPDLPATPEDTHTCVPEEETHHAPQDTAITTTPQSPQQEESAVAAAAECEVPVKSGLPSVPLCASLPHTTSPHSPGQATTPALGPSLPEEHPRDSIESTFHEAKVRPTTDLPADLPSVKSPTVGVTPDEVTIPQGEPHTGLPSEHSLPSSYAVQGTAAMTGEEEEEEEKQEVQGVAAKEVTPTDPSQEGESQTVCAATTQDTTTATEEADHSAMEDTTTTAATATTSKPDTSAPHHPHATDTSDTASCCISDSDPHQRQKVVQGQLENTLQLSLDLVKEEVLHREEDTPPSLTDKAEVAMQDMPLDPAGRMATTGVQGTPNDGESSTVSSAPCPLCGEALTVPLEHHLTTQHICCTFVPAKTTLAYRHHMLQRVTDAADLPAGEDPYAGSLFVCRSCCFVSYDINAVRFHLNIHEEVYQVRPGLEDCTCERRSYSYSSHKWRSLMHHSTHHCHLCSLYFACQEGHTCHTLALHFPAQQCPVCECEVPPSETVLHLAGHREETTAVDTQQEGSSSTTTTTTAAATAATAATATAGPSPTDRFGVSWNIYDNCINFLDGKDFRLGTATKVEDPRLDRSYLALPLSNVEEEAVVPPQAILDPGHDIHRYLKNKRVVRIPGGGEEALRSFSLAVQLDLHKKMNRKGRKGPAERPRPAHCDDLFTVLGIQAPRARPPPSKQSAHPTPPRTPGRKPRRKLSLEIPLEEPPSDGPQLTRTRSGMMQVPRGEGTAVGGREEPTTPLSEGAGPAAAAEVHGEWSREHTYVCCSCGASCLNLADMMDHKWEMHPSVWCAHTMLEGQGLVPHGFRNQFQPPTAQPCMLPLPTATTPTTTTTPTTNTTATTPEVETQLPSGVPNPEATVTHTCTSCHSTFQDVAAFHTHLVECGGLSLVSVPKKKTKKGYRFKRRKGQGMPSNRYGNTSQPTTPLKARTGDRSSGLNTPLTDRPSALSLPTCGVKRRLELAVGSIDNVELKNRLKAIITNTRGPLGGTPSHPGRRPKMKLRKKALDTRRLRKTRHSDRVKEQRSEKTEKEEKVEVSGEDGKGKAGKKGTATLAAATMATTSVASIPEAPKQVKGKESKKKGKKGKKKIVKSEEGQEGVSAASLDTEDKKKGKSEVATDTHASPVTDKLQRVNGFLSKTKKMKKKVGGKVMAAEKQEEKVPLMTCPTTPAAPSSAAEKKGKKGKKAAGKKKVTQSEGMTGPDTEKAVKGAKKTTKFIKSEKRQLEESEAPPAPPSPPQPPSQEAGVRARKVRRTSSVETNTSSVKEEEEEEVETETTAGDEDEEEGGEWNSDRSRIRDALRPKRQAYFSSSSEDTENSDDSEPEVIRNFRSGRGCSGRMGLRTKRSQGSSRYAFRTCFSTSSSTSRRKDHDGGVEKDKEKAVGGGGGGEEGVVVKQEEMEELPLTPRRKRKIANYENQDDYTYVPHESSSDLDYMEASEDEAAAAAATAAAAPKRESPRLGRSKRRSTRLSSKTSSSGSRTRQQEEEEGTEVDGSKAGLPDCTTEPSPQQETTPEEKEEVVVVGEAAGDGRLGEGVPESSSSSASSSVCSAVRNRRRSLEVPREGGTKALKAPMTASAPSSDLEGEARCGSKAAKKKGVALLDRLALSSSFQAQVDEVAGKTQRRKKDVPTVHSDFKDTDEECVREATPGDSEPSARPLRRSRYILSENSASDSQAKDRDPPLKPLRRSRYILSENSASDSQALESDSSMDKPQPPTLTRRRNVIVSSDEAEGQPAIPAKTASEDVPDNPPHSPAKKMRPAKKTQTKTDSNPLQQTPHAHQEEEEEEEEDDDDEDNVPLSTLAHLNRKQNVTLTTPPPRKTAAAAAPRQKVVGKSKKRLKVRQLNRLIKESTAQDSESSSFEGFSSIPSQRWSKAKASSTKKYKKKQSLLKAKALHSSSTASESEASDEPRSTRKTKKLVASPLITTPPAPTEGGLGVTLPQGHGKAPVSHKKAKSNKKYKKKGGKGLGGAGKGSTVAPHSMPVLECMVDTKKAGQEKGQDTPPPPDASTEPPAFKDQQPPADPAKDTSVVPPSLLPAATTTTNTTTTNLEEQAASLPSPLPQYTAAPVVESPSKTPQSRKKRTKSSQEAAAAAKDKASSGGEPLPPLPSPAAAAAAAASPAEHQGNTKITVSTPSPKKAGKRKRSVSACGMAGQEASEAGKDSTAPVAVTAATTSPTAATTKTTTTSKKNGESAKKKKSSSSSKAAKAEVNELTCTDCGLKFGSVASLEDHRQDCLTIAFEMSMMEAEDHLFECPHCHLTFAKKGTQRKHTTSCRLVKYKRYESKAFKKASRAASTTPAVLLPVGDATAVAPPPLPSPGKGSKSSKENISGEVLPGAPDPLMKEVKEVLRVPVYGRNTDKMGAVLVGGNTLQENIKNMEPLQRVVPLAVTDATPKARREPQQLNGRLLNGEHLDPFPTSPAEESPRCSVCGYETSDSDVLAKHRLILRFSRYCQEQTVKEVCALAANYNLGLDAVRGMVSAAATHQGFITLAFDPKQPPVSTLSSLVGAAASTTAKLKEVLASPHCARVLSSLESLAKHYQTSDAVDITGTKQDTLMTLAVLEEVLKDISEADNALLRNRMLKSMRETFEAGTLN